MDEEYGVGLTLWPFNTSWPGLTGPSTPLAKESKRFFFEKKKQKTFANWASGGETSTDKDQKFFASFFHKRSAFFLYFTRSV
jgi:hypothetical protein